MTDANDQRLAALERRVKELEEYKRKTEDANFPLFICELSLVTKEIKDKLKVHADFIKKAVKGLMGHEKLFDIHGDMIRNIDIEISKLTDGYYKVFPEREIQDARVTDQLLKLKILVDPDSKD